MSSYIPVPFVAVFLPFTLAAGGSAAAAQDGNFTLGQIIVTAPRPDAIDLGASSLGPQAIYLFNRHTLDDAANLIPGVVSGNSGGSRNERLIFVRGFDRFQVPLLMDGIRVYLPADNRLDYGRFLTPDIAELQVAKGHASVLDGPGAMGGAINLVTRKPVQELEAEARGTLHLDRNLGYDGYGLFGLVGTKQRRWYAQASFAQNFRDHWDLPGSFRPTINEDGGRRDFSRTRDWRVNVKAAFTPNETDEYALSYIRQEGSKNAPLHITDTSNVSLRNWAWPQWDIESLYFLSTTALGDEATLKTQVFRNSFDNILQAFDDRSQTTQMLNRSFDSPYDDDSWGGSLRLALDTSERNRLTLAFHVRNDRHRESQTSRPGHPASVAEPWQTSEERTWSMAAENRFELSPALQLTLGASYDWRDLIRAEEYGVPPGDSGANRLFSFPRANADALNGQARLDWSGGNDSGAWASISSRVRFPTLFERFSSQFGTAEANPGLKPERATNFEVGGQHRLGPVRVGGSLYWNHLTDALVSVRTPANVNRRENYGTADYYGLDLSLDASLSPELEAGLSYSFIHRDFDVGTPAGGLIRPFELTDVPEHKGFAWLGWKPVGALDIVPSLEFASSRTTVTPASANGLAPVYYQTGAYLTAAFRIDYEVSPGITLGAGGRNLFDRNYTLTDGFPEPGRSFFLSLRVKN